MSDSLWPQGLQHARLLCRPLSPEVSSYSCPLSWWCYLFHPLPPPFPFAMSIRVFSNELALHFKWPEFWSFSFSNSASNENSGLLSFRIDWFDFLAVQGLLSLQHHSSEASILRLSVFFTVQLTSVHDYWKNHSFGYTDLCWQSDGFAF